MMRYVFIFVCLLLVVIGAQGQSTSRPNIILILTDDQRWDALGYAGNDLAHTPEMDKLAGEGLYFSHAMVTTPICSASRASIFTGLQERSHGYSFTTGPVKPELMEVSYPKLLKENGYYTGFFGKFGVNYAEKDRLFDVYESYDRNGKFKDRRGYYYKKLGEDTVHLTRYTGQKAMDFVRQAPNDRPFCLSLSFSAPHAHDPAPDQYFWQDETGEILQDVKVPKPALAGQKYFNRLPSPVREGFNRVRWTWRYDTPEKYQHSVKGYYRMIAGIDKEIGKIRRVLEEEGLAENTVIILMGDNGYFLGERQLAGKWLMYDNSVRVPLIIYDPRTGVNRDLDFMALNIDIPATMLDLAGVTIPESWQGRSLLPFLEESRAVIQRDTVLIEHLWDFPHIPPSEGIRTEKWKYLRYVRDKDQEELYDLERDPQETRDLAGKKKYQGILEGLRRKCDELAIKRLK